MAEQPILILLTNLTVPDLPPQDEDSLIPFLKYLIGGVLAPIVCILGIVGNTLAVITWSRPALRSSTGMFLSAQSAADIGFLLMSVSTSSVIEWRPSLVYNSIYAFYYSHVGTPLYHFFVHCSVWTTLAVTIERYIMVCWATRAKSVCGEKQAKLGILTIVISSLIANIPYCFVYGLGWTKDTGFGSNPVRSTTYFAQGLNIKLYILYISCISLIAIPWFCVLFFNMKIISQIADSNRRMLDKKTSDSALKAKKTENQITRLLLVVTFTYLSMMGPYCLLQIARILDPQGIDPYKKEVGSTVTKSGYVLNSSLNFIFYCMMGRRFRRELKTMLGIKLSEGDMSTTYSSSGGSGKGSGNTDSTVYSSDKK